MAHKSSTEKGFDFSGFWGISPPSVMQALATGEITGRESVLLHIIFCYGQQEGGCYASNNYLAKTLNVSDRQIRASLEKLEGLGFIVREYEEATQARYLATTWKDFPKFQGGGSILPPPRKNASSPE